MTEGLFRRSVLRDGREVTVRPIAIADAAELRDGLKILSPESRYLRFHSQRSELTPDEWRYLTDVDGDRHVAVVAIVEDRIAGVARFVAVTDDVAEVAFVVGDEVQRLGIGALLRDVLVEAAAARGIATLRANVLSHNAPMRKLLRALEHVSERDGVIEVRVPRDTREWVGLPFA